MARNHNISDIDDLDKELFQAEAMNPPERQDSFEDLLKRAHQDRPNTAHQRPKTEQRQRRQKHTDILDKDNENLGEDFESTPWLPPSLDKAIEFKKKHMFRSGDARIDSVDIIHAPDIGSGVSLYFQFAMSMAICLFIMSFLTLPALVFVYNGYGITAEDQDALGMYRYTLGNLGYPSDDPASKKLSKCTTSGYAANETCIHFNNREVSMSDVSGFLTAMEFLQIVVFFIGVFHLYRKAVSVTGKNSKSEASISDYSVMITNIPPDTSDVDLIAHFSNLYPLDKPDWKGRPAVEGAFPVDDYSNSNISLYQGTWIAECILHKGIGNFISSFKSKQHVMESLYRCRAMMKMYAENTPHAHGHNLKRYLKAEQVMIKTGSLIDRVTAQNVKKSGIKIITKETAEKDEHQKRALERISNPASIYYNIEADSVAAFVCFQYGESMARCVNDYTKYSTFPMSLLFPQEMKFKGYKIHVEKAPEPDQIIWEHIEVKPFEKNWLRARTALITFALVVGCFIIILQASIYKSIFSSKIPQLSLCNSMIPQVYTNGSSKVDSGDIKISRPPADRLATYDASCDAVLPGTFYGYYVSKTNASDVVGKYDIAVCTKAAAIAKGYTKYGICPQLDERSFCPCLSTTSKEQCSGCTNSKSKDCPTFNAGVVGACFCYQRLIQLIKGGVAEALNAVGALESEECGEFYTQYSLSSALTYVSVITTSIVNVLSREFLKALAKQEAHTSLDEYQASIMSKIFLSNFTTMAIIVLVAYGKANNSPDLIKALRIFNGPYPDFTVSWYGNVGFYLMTTFIIASFSPLVANLFAYFIGKPLMRMYHHARVQKLESHSIVMQHDLNMLQVGPVFDSTDHSAQLLTLLFFAMTYAPGLPLLMPLCCFAFSLYFRVDKLLLSRFYQKPPNVGDAAIRLVLSYLPFAAILRLGFACWMFSNHEIIPLSTGDNIKAYQSFLDGLKDSAVILPDVRDRLLQTNTFPLFVLLLVIAGTMFIQTVWKQLPFYWILRIGSSLFGSVSVFKVKDIFANSRETGTINGWDLLRMNDPLRRQSSPYTGEYFRYVKHKDEIPDTCMQMFEYAYLTQLSEMEIEEGYKMEDRGDYIVLVKLFNDHNQKKLDGTKAKRGDHKKTYEVVGDHRCYTYDIERIPEYRVAIQGLREGTASMVDYMNQHADAADGVDAQKMLFENAGLTSNILAEYDLRKRNKQNGIDTGNAGFDFDQMEKGEMQELFDAKIKPKPGAASAGVGAAGTKAGTVVPVAGAEAKSGKIVNQANRNVAVDGDFDDDFFNNLRTPKDEPPLVASPPRPGSAHQKQDHVHHDDDNGDQDDHHGEHGEKKKKKKKKKKDHQ